MGKKEAKTNAIRILETMKIPYEARTYECDDFVDAAQIADKLGLTTQACTRLSRQSAKAVDTMCLWYR